MAPPQTGEDAAPEEHLRTIDELEALLHSGSKPRDQWKIGVEYEKPVVARDTGDAVPYEGPSGIGAVLAAIRERGDWEGVYENDKLIALANGRASITLEPGGQFEMSGEQCDSLHCAHRELQEHVVNVVNVGEDLGLRFLGLGITPKTPVDRVPHMPKGRYHIMRRIMTETGSLGLRMMHQTATVQANFDYESEPDAVRKFRLAMAMSPVLVAMSANSPIVDGADSGFKSFRAHIWTDTDAARCGVLPFAFDTDGLFGAYTQYALDVPLYFVVRRGQLLDSGGMTFRQFLERGLDGHHATLSDWKMHLTTLFPEARIKTYIEVRAADAQPQDLVLATPALMKGLLYDNDCLDAALDVVNAWSFDQRMQAGIDCARYALQARIGRHSVQEYARELTEIADAGLARADMRNKAGDDERVYLDPMRKAVEAGRCPADAILEKWNGEWDGDVGRLIEYAAYRL